VILGPYEGLEGTMLLLEVDERIDQLGVCVTYEHRGDRIASPWMHLTPEQAVEIAEAIIGRWGGSTEGLR
jgi:hypothetical protein